MTSSQLTPDHTVEQLHRPDIDINTATGKLKIHVDMDNREPTRMIDSEIIEGVMEAAEDDYLDLTDIMHFTHRLTASQAEALRMAAAIASHLIRAGRITPGDLTDDGLVPWQMSPEESAQRITAEAESWDEPNRIVYPGEIAWFDLPWRIAARAAGEDPAAPRT
ncbi:MULTISPECIES: hypothetical protein [Actinoalloteichus]|uniref:Uncharacterized protein n=1 Tax=Actinoalloteichus fjordicus TaxID=1612552 RepID=A0AAC9PUI5_9PSEU|nr:MULTISPECIES: hypothetical protein [Actinoalloteichus]APU17719.1 hypothetical protein UA74_28600 [Actinoalloteichus fjordicus]APU23797.1 hypothetical protein UA75_29130 [Actinoalloteichus sp. GBA129-24]